MLFKKNNNEQQPPEQQNSTFANPKKNKSEAIDNLIWEKDTNGNKKIRPIAIFSAILLIAIISMLILPSFFKKKDNNNFSNNYNASDKGSSYLEVVANKSQKEKAEQERLKTEKEKTEQEKAAVQQKAQSMYNPPPQQAYQNTQTTQPMYNNNPSAVQPPLDGGIELINVEDKLNKNKPQPAVAQTYTPQPAYTPTAYTPPQQTTPVNMSYQPQPKFLPVGTNFPVVIKNNIRTGQPIMTALCQTDMPILTEDGQVIIPAGSTFEGQVQFQGGKANINFSKITFPNGIEKFFLGYAMNMNGNVGVPASDTNFISRTTNTVATVAGSAYLAWIGQAPPPSTIYNGNQVIQAQNAQPSYTNIIGQKLSNVADQQLNQQAQQNNQPIYEISAGTQILISLSQKFSN